jgi:hypothetical protein
VGAVVVLVGLAAASVLLAVAMSLYPGGTAMDPLRAGHSFWLNFLCDLTSSVAGNGRPNPAGALVGRAALATFAATLAVFWLVLPTSFSTPVGARWRGARVLSGAGLVSSLGLATVPFASGWIHAWAVFAAAIPGIVAGVLALVGTLKFARSRLVVSLLCGAIAAALVDSVLYVRSLSTHPRVVLPALPIGQRLAFLLIVAWIALVAVGRLRKRTLAERG